MYSLSRDITAKVRSCTSVLSALKEHGESVAEAIEARVQPNLREGDEAPRFHAQIIALARHLEAALDTVLDLDQRLFGARARRAGRLAERDDSARALGRRLSGVRQILGGHFHAPRWRQLGFAGRVPREPTALLRVAELVAESLASPDVETLLGEPLFEDPLDTSGYARQLELHVEGLRQAVDPYLSAVRRVDKALAERRSAIEAYDTVFLRVARQFEDLCRLAGRDALAERVRPSRKRRGQTEVRPEVTAASETTAVAPNPKLDTDPEAASAAEPEARPPRPERPAGAPQSRLLEISPPAGTPSTPRPLEQLE